MDGSASHPCICSGAVIAAFTSTPPTASADVSLSSRENQMIRNFISSESDNDIVQLRSWYGNNGYISVMVDSLPDIILKSKEFLLIYIFYSQNAHPCFVLSYGLPTYVHMS